MSSILGGAIDERFLMHRLRSTSAAAVVGGVVSTLLFAYHYYFNHFWSWDLVAVSLAIVVTKWGFVIWYRFTQ
ncbi:MAG: hypothetical protein DMD82_01635 [Candidatus Rokuibacteriota bacterium]|nr:MAG: hypothetical protein DMD82_01635 [Candidatus Rokubacteria bacterium]